MPLSRRATGQVHQFLGRCGQRLLGKGRGSFDNRGRSLSAAEKRLLTCLHESAELLPESPAAGTERLALLAERCCAETGISPQDMDFLLSGLQPSTAAKHIRKVQRAWRRALKELTSPDPDRPRIAMILPDGQAIRTFLFTDVCRNLSRWSELYILSPYDVEADVRALGPTAHYLPIPAIRRANLDYLVGYLGYFQTGSPTIRRFAQRLDENLSRSSHSEEPMSTALRVWQIGRAYELQGKYLPLYEWSMRFFGQCYSLNTTSKLLRRLQPSFVLNTSVVSWPARLWTRSAALAGIPVISNVISWDNISTKTLIDEFVDTFLIWSKEMDEDFSVSLPFLRDKPRVVVGSPQFEPILQGKGLLERADFMSSFGLDPRNKLILYTTGSKTLFPYEPECLDRLLDHWRKHLRKSASVMVRMHPKDRETRYSAVMAKYPEVPFTVAGETLADDNVWIPRSDDISLLVNQINHCSMIINMASTMTLEGFSIDKPTINIGFTLGPSVSARYPMEDYYRSRHYTDLVESGAVLFCEDYQQMFDAIEELLSADERDFGIQRQLLRRKCEYIEDSSTHIDHFLRSYALAGRPFAAPGLGQLSRLASGLKDRLRAAHP